MILPSKHIDTRHSLLGLGAEILLSLPRPSTVTGLWDRMRHTKGVATFERFAQALALLHAVGAVDFRGGLLVKIHD